MTTSDVMGAVMSVLAVAIVFVATMVMPPIDDAAVDKAQAAAKAKLTADKLFTKWPDPAIASMSMPVAPPAKDADK